MMVGDPARLLAPFSLPMLLGAVFDLMYKNRRKARRTKRVSVD